MQNSFHVSVHPVVLFQILDFYERRNDEQFRVIGTLLGNNDGNGSVVLTNCFAVPHSESEDEAAIDIEFQRTMLELHRKANSNENIVGWFSTGNTIRGPSVLIHEYYARETKTPIHLLIDTNIDTTSGMDLKAFLSTDIGVPGSSKGTMFVPVTVQLDAYHHESVACDVMQNGKLNIKRSVAQLDDINQLNTTTSRLSAMLDQVISYIDDILTEQRQADSVLGRSLAQLINTVPKLDKETFSDMVSSSTKDLLMLSYLTSMIRTHLNFNEKLVAL